MPREETTMRFMIMHKNDPKTEAGERPRLIHTVRGVGYVAREA